MAAMATPPARSSDQPSRSASSETTAAAAAMTPEDVISHVKAKRKCHQPTRQPTGAIASNSRARTARLKPRSTPACDQLIGSVLALRPKPRS